jgi:ribosomal protein S18 acetylase RimI-like enzyme
MWRAAFEYGVGIKDPHPIEEQIAYLHERVLPENFVQLAWLDNRLAGFIAFNAESVAQLHVRIDLHRQGIGTYLLDLAKSEAKSGTLWLFTFQRNLVARSFYEHHGFKPVLFGFEPVWQLADVKYVWSERGNEGQPVGPPGQPH